MTRELCYKGVLPSLWFLSGIWKRPLIKVLPGFVKMEIKAISFSVTFFSLHIIFPSWSIQLLKHNRGISIYFLSYFLTIGDAPGSLQHLNTAGTGDLWFGEEQQPAIAEARKAAGFPTQHKRILNISFQAKKSNSLCPAKCFFEGTCLSA